MLPSLTDSTRRVQENLATYCRTGELTEPLPGVRLDRLPWYRRLVWGTVREHLDSAFPIAQQWLPVAEWEGLTHRFFSTHDQWPAPVWQMPGELLHYLAAHEPELLARYPALPDLLRFEWTEVEVFMMPDQPTPVRDAEAENPLTAPVITPESQLLVLHWPVHRVRPADLRPEHEGRWFAFAFREPATGRVRFLDLAPGLALLVGELLAAPRPLAELLPAIAQTFGVADASTLLPAVSALLRELTETGGLLGYQILDR
jgi:hypothetical protein